MLELQDYIPISKMKRIPVQKLEKDFEKISEEIEKDKIPVIITSENRKDLVLVPFSSLTPSCRKRIEEEIKKKTEKGEKEEK